MIHKDRQVSRPIAREVQNWRVCNPLQIQVVTIRPKSPPKGGEKTGDWSRPVLSTPTGLGHRRGGPIESVGEIMPRRHRRYGDKFKTGQGDSSMSALADIKAILTDEGLANIGKACAVLIAYCDCSMSEAFARREATVDVMRFLYATHRWAAGILSERLGRTVSTDVQRRTVQELTTDDGLAGIITACNTMITYLDVATANADELEALNAGHIEASDELLGWIYGTRQAAENMLAERIDIQERN